MGLSETNIDSEKIVWNKLVPFSGRGACSCVVCMSDDSRTATEEKKNKKGRESGTLNFRSNRTVYVRTVFNVLAVVARGIDCVT